MAMVYTTRNGYQLHYIEKGTGNFIVFVHGSASDYRTWEKQQQEFSNYYHTVAYSRRYHWPNQRIAAGEDYSMAGHVGDLEDLLAKLGSKPVHLVGHSYGAFVCLLLAAKSPQLVRTLVLAEPPAITLFVSNSPKPTELLRLLFSRPKTALALIKFGATGIGPATAAVKAGKLEAAMEIFGKATLGTQAFVHLSEARREQVRANLIKAEFLGSGFPPLDLSEIRRIVVPVLLVAGEKSPRMFHYLLDRLSELLAHAERITVPGASHILHEDNPAFYNAAVHAFLRKFEIG
ncbi:hypothetical protein GCM10023188_18150 [Pontibacter saemangeumensis]|uniref:AB hydrolase-1 domain-containing protein n=1 Tax=Pontibacter saemangeumensis TaxID=1084525 RepID=A0ABP8LJM7_9BACT